MRKTTREILVQKQFSQPGRLLVVCSKGKVRAIGVDNFTQDRLADFLF